MTISPSPGRAHGACPRDKGLRRRRWAKIGAATNSSGPFLRPRGIYRFFVCFEKIDASFAALVCFAPISDVLG